jgi:3',5'-cyclic AMP phosphodiesterase CpdA
MKATSDLLMTGVDAVATLGDNQYEDASYAKFMASYDLSWGRLKTITYPAPGNHEYYTSGAAGYYQYFGARAGAPTKGYYSYDLGGWHIVVLNSNCEQVGGCSAGSPQETWVRNDLAAHPTACSLAYWHHPRYSSGRHGNNTSMTPLYEALMAHGVDVVLSGHDHTYERFAPQNASGKLDLTRGIRQFVVGTGGRSLYSFGTIQPNSEVRNGDTYGVLKMTLHPTSYEWQFVPVHNGTFTDAGRSTCH